MRLKTRGQLILIQKLIDEAIYIYNNISTDDELEVSFPSSAHDGFSLIMLLSDTKNTLSELIDK